ncbi:unnamed protein product [Orchesella dallaii]|uniref:F-box domain-containing protein n=1 Tax=Orchesella dallaii TaxID=48710 RepID=A0ABP1RW96_9HEXA
MDKQDRNKFTNWMRRLRNIFRKSKKPGDILPSILPSSESELSKLRISSYSQETIFPPELMEAILDKFHYVADLPTLLRCRLVCSHWKQVVEKKLETEHLFRWTNLNQDEDYSLSIFQETRISTCFYSVVPDTVSSGLTRIWLPPAIAANPKGNPFPNKSAAVIGFENCHSGSYGDRACPKLAHRIESKAPYEEVVKLFQNYGKYLTTLVLHDLIIYQDNFCLVLASTESLKALTLSFVKVAYSKKEVKINVPKCLTHLHILSSHKNTETFFKWFLTAVSPQIVNLKIRGHTPFYGEVTLEQEIFKKLKCLHVYSRTEWDLAEMLRKVESPPALQHITAVWCRMTHHYLAVEDVIKFIAKFCTSLVSLKIHVKLCDLTTPFENCGKIFSNVKFVVMAITSQEYIAGWDEVSIRESILPWFPKVESVIIVNSFDVSGVGFIECPLCNRNEKLFEVYIRKKYGRQARARAGSV